MYRCLWMMRWSCEYFSICMLLKLNMKIQSSYNIGRQLNKNNTNATFSKMLNLLPLIIYQAQLQDTLKPILCIQSFSLSNSPKQQIVLNNQQIITQRLFCQRNVILLRSRLIIWLLIIKFSSQLMHQRRCQEIPAHFIPKHHSKYLMRKTILNSKFQWLSKYVSDVEQVNQTSCLSKFIKIQPKETFNVKEKKKLTAKNKQNNVHFFEDKRQRCTNSKEKSHLANTISSNLSRKSRVRIQTDPEQSFCEERDKPKNKSLLMNRTYLRKTPSFFEKESRKTYSQKIKSKEASHTNIFRRNYQIQNFALTPWGMQHEGRMQHQNAQNDDFICDP